MSQIKQLAGQTMVYGMGSIVPRLLNFAFLLPFYTRTFKDAEYGVITELYAYVVILNVIITFGMETGFFRYSQDKKLFQSVFTTATLVVGVLAGLFLVLANVFVDSIADLIQYSDRKEYIVWFSIIIALDCIAALPFAKLRRVNQPRKFAIIKLINVGVNIFLVLFFLKGWPIFYENNPEWWLNRWYDPNMGVGYVFVANLVTSSLTFIILLPEFRLLGGKISKKVFVDLLKFSMPLVIVGIAGSINEVADKILLKFWFTGDNPMGEVGVYGANFRLAVIMTLFVQMFKYAFEPFLFAQKGKDSNALYAQVMDVFVAFGMFIFLACTIYSDFIIDMFFSKDDVDYSQGSGILPIILMANLALGIYYSLSVWYKVTDLTRYAAVMALGGSVITIGLNALLIPKYSYVGSSWAHLATYVAMMLASYFWGRKIMPIPYRVKTIVSLIGVGVLLYFAQLWIREQLPAWRYVINSLILVGYVVWTNQKLGLIRLFFRK